MQQAIELVLSYMEGLECPRAVTVAILARYEEWDQLTSLEAVPSSYVDADSYWRAAAATDLLRKVRGLPTSVDPKKEALRKWWVSEHQCARSNDRLSPYLFGNLFHDADERVLSILDRAREKIVDWIGTRPTAGFTGRFGPGATYSNPSGVCLVPDKLSSEPTFTPASWHYLIDWTSTWWATSCAEAGRAPMSVRGNIYFSVPKTARTERACGKEPSLNGYFQLGLGGVLRRRLKSVGFDLDDGQRVHQRIARSASITGDFATLDLSSASDTICTNLVKLLLPRGWFRALDDLRSPFTQVDGRWVRLEKFSSMGNGYTFELETLIFAALAAVVYPEDSAIPGVNLFVYGDDIIVPTETSLDVKAILEFCGFTLNPRKSFLSGEFRESCGGDFFRGEAVRPFLLEELPNEPQHYISWANGLRRTAEQRSVPLSDRPSLLRAWLRILDSLPRHIRGLRGPQELGDLLIHDDESRWQFRWRESRRYFGVYRPITSKRVAWGGWGVDTQLASALYFAGSEQPVPGGLTNRPGRKPIERRWLVPRDAVTGYKVGRVQFS